MLTSYGSKALDAITNDKTIVERRMDGIIEISVKQHHCAHGSTTARQVADELRLQGISQETVFVSWHSNAFGLSLLREWLESEGEYGVLPLDSYCVPIIPYTVFPTKPWGCQIKEWPVLPAIPAHHVSNHDGHTPRAVREESPRHYRRSAAEMDDGRLRDTT